MTIPGNISTDKTSASHQVHLQQADKSLTPKEFSSAGVVKNLSQRTLSNLKSKNNTSSKGVPHNTTARPALNQSQINDLKTLTKVLSLEVKILKVEIFFLKLKEKFFGSSSGKDSAADRLAETYRKCINLTESISRLPCDPSMKDCCLSLAKLGDYSKNELIGIVGAKVAISKIIGSKKATELFQWSARETPEPSASDLRLANEIFISALEKNLPGETHFSEEAKQLLRDEMRDPTVNREIQKILNESKSIKLEERLKNFVNNPKNKTDETTFKAAQQVLAKLHLSNMGKDFQNDLQSGKEEIKKIADSCKSKEKIDWIKSDLLNNLNKDVKSFTDANVTQFNKDMLRDYEMLRTDKTMSITDLSPQPPPNIKGPERATQAAHLLDNLLKKPEDKRWRNVMQASISQTTVNTIFGTSVLLDSKIFFANREARIDGNNKDRLIDFQLSKVRPISIEILRDEQGQISSFKIANISTLDIVSMVNNNEQGKILLEPDFMEGRLEFTVKLNEKNEISISEFSHTTKINSK